MCRRDSSCCQLYTIRLNVNEFLISRKQKKALDKFNRFLNGELEHKVAGSKPEVAEGKKEEKSVAKKYEEALGSIVIKAVLELLLKDKDLLKISKDLAFNEVKAKIRTAKTKNSVHGDFVTNAAIVTYSASKKVSKKEDMTILSSIQKAIINKIEVSCAEQKLKVVASENGFINFTADPEIKAILDKESTSKSKSLAIPNKSESKEELKKSSQEEAKEASRYAKYFKEFVPVSYTHLTLPTICSV
eukprot:TRINITY_DN14744_c0_g1_i8.p1 TRINITY_DN14744_c0_g1~~TRINITY_DN14744_c0_g1_i8.p1  ORF type:complete len:245 (-),score=57.14 TRINITY_DN14744_c0_g1_i8:44-778(-)